MTNPVAIVRKVTDGELKWDGLVFICPGCKELWPDASGLHMLPVNSTTKTPSWDWDYNFEAPTLSPSILTQHGPDLKFICHSFLKAGVFQFLDDCSHPLKGQFVSMIPLEDWMLD
jgi:hypothetical protein